ncbi:MAG: queuosine precursor transporter [Gammaproteobacteria bacterium]|nr:queuosine precursor transporter [Gammaproteobacteria bacterium]
MLKSIKKIFDYYFRIVSTEIIERKESKYKVVSESFDVNDKFFYITLTVHGLAKPITKKLSDVYNKEWLSNVNSEDAARLAFLTYVENSGNLEVYHSFPSRKSRITKHTIFLMVMYIAGLIISNLSGFKICVFNGFGYEVNIPAGLIFFPFTYIFDNTITEIYGFAVSRIIIWCGLFASVAVTVGLKLTAYLQPASFWPFQEQYSLVFSHAPRIMFASFIAYFIGEFLNSAIISKMKILTHGKCYALRLITSTSVGALFDSIVFCGLAFYGSYDNSIIGQMIILQYIFKVGYEISALPLTYFITGYLKSKDKVDYYDFETSYNPFSLSCNK